MDERELILKVSSGDKEAFGELVKIHQKKIFISVWRFFKNDEDAKELTQDAFISAYQAIKGFRLRSSFYTWIYRIAINLCYHRLKSRQYKTGLKTQSLKEYFPSLEPSPSQSLAAKEQEAFLRQALVSLKKERYEAIVLHDLEGFSYKEIAKMQNCSLGTVMSRLYRGRLELAKILTQKMQ